MLIGFNVESFFLQGLPGSCMHEMQEFGVLAMVRYVFIWASLKEHINLCGAGMVSEDGM